MTATVGVLITAQQYEEAFTVSEGGGDQFFCGVFAVLCRHC